MAFRVHAPHSEAATADLLSRLFWRRNRHLRKSNHRIARVLQNIPKAGTAVRYWYCKMAGRFLSITQTAVLRTDDGRSLAERKVFGELQRSRLRKAACLESTLP